MTTTMPKPGELIEVFDITTPTGTTLRGHLHRTERRSGRRVIVRDAGGAVLWDSDDCYDVANVRNKLETWLSGM
jgi:hypothetical protein